MSNGKSVFLGVLLSFWMPVVLLSQVSYSVNYHFRAGNPGGVNTESDFMIANWDTIMGGGLFENQWSGPVAIPFDFEFFGRSVSHFRTSANGLLSFDSNPSTIPGNNGPLPSPVLPDSTIACFWDAFTVNPPTGTNDQVQTKVFGQAPNRQFWIRWHSFKWGPANFEFVAVVLEETSQNIYLVDMYGSLQSYNVTSSVGVQANAQFAVGYGDDQIPLSGATSNNADNSYYRFEPYPIEAYDMVPTALLSPKSNSCQGGLEDVSIQFSNVGLFAATGIQARYSIDGGSFSAPETIPGSLASGDTMDYTFTQQADLSTPGLHTLKVVVEVSGDNKLTNDTLEADIYSLLRVSSFPYQENFEQGTSGWVSGGENSSWELGYPNHVKIQGATSGVRAWVTNLRGPYAADEKSWVASPCFDLSGADADMRVALQIWWETEFSWDGAVLQSSTDAGESWNNLGKMGDPDHWFNDNTIAGLPGGSPEGWSGSASTGNGSGGWVQASHAIGPELAGKDQVRFRIAFGSDNAQQDEGVAFDDFILAAPPKVELGDDGFYCEGAVLDIGHGDKTILWSTGETTSSITLRNSTGKIFADSMITVAVTDALGLTSRDTILVSMTPPLVIEQADITDIACFGDSSGAIVLTNQGGASPYTIDWSHGGNTGAIDGLTSGVYSVTVTDVNGCQADSSFIVEDHSTPIILTPSVVHAGCKGEAIGQIDLQVSGGNDPYVFQWNHGDSTATISQLGPGTYTVQVTDSMGCVVHASMEIEKAGDLNLQLEQQQDASCKGSQDGSIDISTSGGTPPYTYAWNTGATTEDISALGAGIYFGTVTDSLGCVKQIPEFVVSYTDSIPDADFDFLITGAGVGFADSSMGATAWFWDFGDGKGSSTSQFPVYVYQENGSYDVRLIASNLCGNDTIVRTVSIQTVGLEESLYMTGIEVFPNPAKDQMYVHFPVKLPETAHIELLGLDGREIEALTLSEISQGREYLVKVRAGVPAGLYLLKIQVQDKQTFRKLRLKSD